MTTFGRAGPAEDDTGRPGYEVALWRAKAGIVALAVGAGLVTFIALRGTLGLLLGLAASLPAIVYVVARDRIAAPRDAETRTRPLDLKFFLPARRNRTTRAAMPARAEPSTQSAAGFLERLRKSLAVADSEAENAVRVFEARGVSRLRLAGTDVSANGEPAAGTNGGNELRHYLRRQRATPASGARRPGIRAIQETRDADGTVFASLDAVLDHIMAAGSGAAPRSLLVAGAPAMVDATAEAIVLARALVVAGFQAVLLDLAHGPHSVAAALRLSRAPGLSCLAAGQARFEDIIRIDAETPLHVIAAGNPRFASSADADTRFKPIFAALTETYDSVVLYADRAALLRLVPLLGAELAVAVAVLPAGMGTNADLRDLAALGCEIIGYEKVGTVRRPRFMGWAAAG